MRSTRRASSATRWPSAASARAVASPMPDEAPVMTATRPVVFSVLTMVSSFVVEVVGRLHCRTDRRDLRGPVRGVLRGHPWSGLPRRTVTTVDAASELSQFLTSRRAKVTPEQAGLPTLRPAARAGTATRGGRLAGRGQRRVLQAPGARQRQRRLRRRPRRARRRAATRRRRARPPVRPRPRRQPDRPDGADAARSSSASGRSCSASSTASPRRRP